MIDSNFQPHPYWNRQHYHLEEERPTMNEWIYVLYFKFHWFKQNINQKVSGNLIHHLSLALIPSSFKASSNSIGLFTSLILASTFTLFCWFREINKIVCVIAIVARKRVGDQWAYNNMKLVDFKYSRNKTAGNSSSW